MSSCAWDTEPISEISLIIPNSIHQTCLVPPIFQGNYSGWLTEHGLIPLCSLQWRHNDHNGVSNHQPHRCLLNGLFRRRSKKTSKLRVTGLCVGNSPGPVNSPHKGPVTWKMFPFDDAIMCMGHRAHVRNLTNHLNSIHHICLIQPIFQGNYSGWLSEHGRIPLSCPGTLVVTCVAILIHKLHPPNIICHPGFDI